jgi:hypothetical protein
MEPPKPCLPSRAVVPAAHCRCDRHTGGVADAVQHLVQIAATGGKRIVSTQSGGGRMLPSMHWNCERNALVSLRCCLFVTPAIIST